MAKETYNIIGTDRDGDWLLLTCDGKDWANYWVERAKQSHPEYIRVQAVKCAA